MNTAESKQLEAIQVIGRKIFRFFASLQLAVVLIVCLMGVLAAGTIIESLHGAETAGLVIYKSPWFSLLLLFLGMNVLAAALDRYPWKIKHTGFVITHLGIILVLIGSFMTQRLMIDGQIVLSENETGHFITLFKPMLYIYSEKQDKSWQIPIKKRPFEWNGRQNISEKSVREEKLPFDIDMLSYYPKARFDENLAQAENGPAALKMAIHNDFVNQEIFLIEDSPTSGEVSLGPAKFKFAKGLLKENAAGDNKTPYLEFQIEENVLQIPLGVEVQPPAEVPLEGTDYQVQILSLYKNAVVSGKELLESPEPEDKAFPFGKNPAAKIIIKGKDFSEAHTVFAKFPDFPTVHGLVPSKIGAKVLYRLPNTGSKGESHELRFVRQNEKLVYQVQDGMKITTGKVTLGEEISTGWMNLKFKVSQYFPHSKMARVYTPVMNSAEGENIVLAIQVDLKNPRGESQGDRSIQTLWLGDSMKEDFSYGGDDYTIILGEKRIPSGFRLTLKDFRVENYPGTDRPASFESDVTLKDDARGIVKNQTISMNEPLKYRGVQIYQSGYRLPEQPGEVEMSIFSVGRDPGVPLKYLGTIVMVSGILTMFYTRRFSSRGGRIA